MRTVRQEKLVTGSRLCWLASGDVVLKAPDGGTVQMGKGNAAWDAARRTAKAKGLLTTEWYRVLHTKHSVDAHTAATLYKGNPHHKPRNAWHTADMLKPDLSPVGIHAASTDNSRCRRCKAETATELSALGSARCVTCGSLK